MWTIYFLSDSEAGAGAAITGSSHVQGFTLCDFIGWPKLFSNKNFIAPGRFVRPEFSENLCKSWPVKQGLLLLVEYSWVPYTRNNRISTPSFHFPFILQK